MISFNNVSDIQSVLSKDIFIENNHICAWADLILRPQESEARPQPLGHHNQQFTYEEVALFPTELILYRKYSFRLRKPLDWFYLCVSIY